MPATFDRLRQRLRELGPAGILAAIWLTAPALVGTYVLVDLGRISGWLGEQGHWAPVIFTSVLMIGSGLGVLPTTSQAVLGGWVLGPVVGIICALLAFAGASTIGLILTRTIAGDRVERMIAKNPDALAVRDALVGKSFLRTLAIVALLRVPPNSPFAFMNLVLASTGVPAVPMVLGTVLGMFPRTFTIMLFASAAARTGAKDIQTFVTQGPGWPLAVAGLLAMLAVMAVIGTIAQRTLAKLHPESATWFQRKPSSGASRG